jgi:acetyl esterase/lipase
VSLLEWCASTGVSPGLVRTRAYAAGAWWVPARTGPPVGPNAPAMPRRHAPARPALVALGAVLALAGCAVSGPGPGADDPTSATTGASAVTLELQARPQVTTVAYGDHPDQVLDVHLPAVDVHDPRQPTVVLVHGGFWRDGFRRDLMVPLAEDLAARGVVVVNVEYRRVGGAGGWPVTLTDVGAAVDHLATLGGPVDTDRVVTVGHSAGGHLATWVAARHRLPAGAPGADPLVRPCAAVSQAGVIDLLLAERQGLGGGAVADLLGGGSDHVPDRWQVADPVRLVPLGVPVLLVHGASDDIVPPDVSTSYAAAARTAGDVVDVVVEPGDHFAVVEASHPLWAAVVERLPGLCPA